MSARLVSFHHRLSGLNGHKYAEVLGLIPAARERGLEYLLFMHEGADAATRQAFPHGHAVLHDATFHLHLSFDERCADFASMLKQHAEPVIRRDDWLFVTTATQCEVRGLLHWLRQVPEARRPWIFTCFHSDRWNRYGIEERARQVCEFTTLAADLAQSDRDVVGRVVIGAVTEALCRELRALLGIPVALVAMMLPSSPYVPSEGRGAGQALVGFLGGARPEKGAHRLAAILGQMAGSDNVGFIIQLANEQLSPEQLAELCEAAAAPNVSVVPGALEQSLYRSLVAKADILLMPYERIPYSNRPSAVFIEAASTGRPTIAPSGSWMGDQIEADRAAGVTYRGDDIQAIVTAILTAVANLPELMEKARTRSGYWRSKMEVGPVLDWFAEEIARRQRFKSRLFRLGDLFRHHRPA